MRIKNAQHDHHCIMNVAYKPCRIQAISDDRMTLRYEGTTVTIVSPPLSGMKWEAYCAAAAQWLAKEGRRLETERQQEAAFREAAILQDRREAQKEYRALLAHERLLASGYGSIDDLEREVEFVDLEDTDPVAILEVVCQMTLDELQRKNS